MPIESLISKTTQLEFFTKFIFCVETFLFWSLRCFYRLLKDNVLPRWVVFELRDSIFRWSNSVVFVEFCLYPSHYLIQFIYSFTYLYLIYFIHIFIIILVPNFMEVKRRASPSANRSALTMFPR